MFESGKAYLENRILQNYTHYSQDDVCPENQRRTRHKIHKDNQAPHVTTFLRRRVILMKDVYAKCFHSIHVGVARARMGCG